MPIMVGFYKNGTFSRVKHYDLMGGLHTEVLCDVEATAGKEISIQACPDG